MNSILSSLERMLLAINHQEADRVPLVFNVFTWNPPPHLKYSSALERVDKFLHFGIDDTISLSAPFRYHPDVTTRTWREITGERYPILFKEYETPKGTLRQIAWQTEDWPHGDDIPIVGDHNISRSQKFPVESPEDLEKLPYLFFQPNREQLNDFKEHVQNIKKFASDRQILIEGHAGGFGDYAAWLMGIQNLIIAMCDRPGFVHQLLDTILEWEMRDIDILLDTSVVDVIIHRGWYECADFWSPHLYRQFIAPRLKKKIQLVHQAGKKFGYIMSTGIMPLLDIFSELDFDILIHVDPVQGGAHLPRLKKEIGERVCFWGGVNSAITLGRGSKDEIRDAVTFAISTLAPRGGLILSAADCLFSDTPWENVRTMIERWREIGTYPIRIAYTQHLGGIWYHGAIDEVAVYDRALSEIEVQKNYADRKERKCI
ncbi:TPA: hypothetical protein EYP66_14620 [Candidatus Poribacteria bacterium]|nr:hypothetical protein [Candidatus Poribacteria bacterium]